MLIKAPLALCLRASVHGPGPKGPEQAIGARWIDAAAGLFVIRCFVRPGVMATKKYTDFGRPLKVKAKNK